MNMQIAAENIGAGPEVSLSRGCSFGGNGVSSFAEPYRLADERMYQDKKDGRCVRVPAQKTSPSSKNI